MRIFYAFIAAVFIVIGTSCSGNHTGSGTTDKDSIVNNESSEIPQNVSDAENSGMEESKDDDKAEDVVMTRMVSNGKPSVVDFSATWCGPCKVMKPIFHKLAAEYADKYNFITIDVDDEPALAEKYHIQAVPTFIFIDADGEEGDRITGAVKESELRDMLQNPAWF